MMILERRTGPGGEVVFVSPDGRFKMSNMHVISNTCLAEGCVIHNPTETAPANAATPPWPYNWREDGIIERLCPHGIGHPDADALRFSDRTPRAKHGYDIHGCDGCCSAPTPTISHLDKEAPVTKPNPYNTWRHIQDLRKKAQHNAQIAREHQDKANRQNAAADELEELINDA